MTTMTEHRWYAIQTTAGHENKVRSATVVIIIFVLFLALVITALDAILNGLLIQLLPSLFAK